MRARPAALLGAAATCAGRPLAPLLACRRTAAPLPPEHTPQQLLAAFLVGLHSEACVDPAAGRAQQDGERAVFGAACDVLAACAALQSESLRAGGAAQDERGLRPRRRGGNGRV